MSFECFEELVRSGVPRKVPDEDLQSCLLPGVHRAKRGSLNGYGAWRADGGRGSTATPCVAPCIYRALPVRPEKGRSNAFGEHRRLFLSEQYTPHPPWYPPISGTGRTRNEHSPGNSSPQGRCSG